MTKEDFFAFAHNYADKLQAQKSLNERETAELRALMDWADNKLSLNEAAKTLGIEIEGPPKAKPSAEAAEEPAARVVTPPTVEGGEWDYAPQEREEPASGVARTSGSSTWGRRISTP